MNGKVTIQLQHHSPAEVIEWDRRQYEGTEYENAKYGTFKPWGLYLAEPLAYMNWRYETHAVRNSVCFVSPIHISKRFSKV